MKNLIRKLHSSDIIKVALIKPYLSFLLSVIFSQIAFNMMNVVLIFLIFFLTESNFLVSLILFISLIPQVLLSFSGGVFADTHDKKTILFWVNVVRAVIIGVLFFVTDSALLVYIIAFLVSVATQFYIPAEAPVIPKLVPQKLLIPANSLFGLALFGSTLIGFIIAGPAIALVGRSNAFLLIVAFFLLAGFFAKLIPGTLLKETKELTEEVSGSFISNLRESYKTLKEATHVTTAFVFLTISQVVIFILAIIVPGYADAVLHIQAEQVSFLLFAPAAIGMILAAVLVGTIFEHTNRNILIGCGIFISGIMLALFPQLPKISNPENILIFVAAVSFIGGIANALVFIPAQATIQERIPENYRSKIYGLLFAAIGFLSLMPLLVVGGLADTIGVDFVLYVVGFAVLVSGIIQIFSLLRSSRKA